MMFLVRSSKGGEESSGFPEPSGRSDMLPGCNPGVGGAPASACSACQSAFIREPDHNLCILAH